MADRAEPGDPREPKPGAQSAAGLARVFISYASQDKAVANTVCQGLEKAGVACWVAPRDVQPGTEYADAIVAAINEAQTLVLVLSENSVGSSHVGREIERAASKHKRIVAFRNDTAALSRSLEYFLSNSQWIDVPALGMSTALPKLVDAIGQGSATPAQEILASKRTGGTKQRVAIAAVILMCVGAAAAVGMHFWSLNHHAEQAAAAITEKSIAVLPFTDMSEKRDQEYFADGMAEEILDLLAKIPGLTVIGRTSSFQFKGKNEDLRTVGTKLNAAFVLEGSVRKSGDQVRITAQLVNSRTGAHEWSETYDRPIGDVLKLQDAIAFAVVRHLQLTVAPEFLEARSTLRDKDTYDLMLRGRHAIDSYDKEGTDEGVALFQQALDRDPASADAALWLAQTYAEQGEMGFVAPTLAFENALRALVIARRLGAQGAAVHELLGEIHTIYDWDWAAADSEFRQTEKLAPNSADSLYGEALLSLALGRWDDALSKIKATQAQDPLDPVPFAVLSWIQLRRGYLQEAEAAVRRALDISPTYGWQHYYLGLVLLARGDRDAAFIEMQQEITEEGKRQGLATAYYALGRKSDSDAALAGMLHEDADRNAFGIAEVYAFRGQSDDAMYWLERAYAQKDESLYYIKGDLPLRNLLGDPRYKAFLRKMNLPE
jgi:TolB-like protein/Tfp pilus assembly protein PilF